jgi:hypothetical protein
MKALELLLLARLDPLVESLEKREGVVDQQ